ncbi:hypothetical protein GMDG_06618 [Pseudogymnoascus destructans 20631-21]|uniref:Uncharacterized protein n=1 Tax=Pseudogymnoascus destructans (strain ATCC MYA-4855 / 20631-21) TaxID=658429 RepID=L8FWW1_PSED2|nr:hypothetical protein GMDG_06618 [Pseudogymnoascus destructans 20631-21]
MGKAMFEPAHVCLPQIDSLLDFAHDCFLPIDSLLDPCYTGNRNTGIRKGHYFWLEFHDKFLTSWTKVCRPNGLQPHEVAVLPCVHEAGLFFHFISLTCKCFC